MLGYLESNTGNSTKNTTINIDVNLMLIYETTQNTKANNKQ